MKVKEFSDMNTQKQFLSYIEAVENIIKPLQINDNKLSYIKACIENSELIVPVVGGFSAGKSTLINSFLGEEILPTAVTPETALATELRYSSTNYIESVSEDGVIVQHELSDFLQLKDNAQKFKNLRVYLNNDNLQAIQPLVLVDMPGFDAPIEKHNQAILNYLSLGVYFVFLTSVEDGNITLSMKREIENIQQFGKGFAFCISKTNLRTLDDVNAVQKKISEQLVDDFDHIEPVVLLDMDGGNNLKNILQAINPEKLFHTLFIDDLRENYLELVQSINVRISTFKSNKQNTDDTILALQNAIHRLNEQKSFALTEVENRYSTNKINAIADKVTQNLLMKKEQLIELALRNQQAFGNELNDLIKNTLLSEVQRSFKNIGTEIIQDFSNNIHLHLTSDKLIVDSAMLNRIQSGVESLISRATSGMDHLTNKMNERNKTNDATKMYRAVTTIVGVTTSVVAPVLELVVTFLPDIIQFIAQKTQERKMREQVEQQIMHTIIPNIKNKIRESLPDIFNEQVSMLITQISEEFEAQLKQKHDEIQLAEAEKAKKSAELESLIVQLENGKQQLTTIANQTLFV